MDIQKEKNLYLAELLEREVIKKYDFDDIVFKHEINAFHSCYLSARFIDNINFGWSAWQAAKSQVVPEGLSINLSGHDIQTIANFMCYEDPENLDTEVTIQDCKVGFNGAGIYAWVSEYPEEGGIKLGEAQEQSHDSQNP